VLDTGDPDQVDNGIWLTSIVGAGNARQLGVYGQSPTLSVGADAGSHGTVELYSASPDGTEAATATIAATGAPGVGTFAALNLLAGTAGGIKSFAELSSESEVWFRTAGPDLLLPQGIAAVQPGTTATPETPHPLTLTTPANWTVVTQPTYQLDPDGQYVDIDGELTATAAIAAGATLATVSALAAYQPSGIRRLTWCYNTGTTTVVAVLASVSTGGVITTFPAIPSGSTLNISGRYRLLGRQNCATGVLPGGLEPPGARLEHARYAVVRSAHRPHPRAPVRIQGARVQRGLARARQ
jgi:hypothetical protein